MFCKHNWAILYEKFIESNIERMKNKGIYPKTAYGDDVSAKHFVIVACTKCGKIKKYETET